MKLEKKVKFAGNYKHKKINGINFVQSSLISLIQCGEPCRTKIRSLKLKSVKEGGDIPHVKCGAHPEYLTLTSQPWAQLVREDSL